MRFSFNRRSSGILIAGLIVISAVGITAFAQMKRSQKVEVWGYQVVAKYPHDKNAFTQGLIYRDGQLYEGTGKLGASSLRLVELSTGKVKKIIPLNSHYFGEGITLLDNRIYQLTWQNRIGIVYDLKSLEVEKTFNYSGEGWGLTNDGKHLILSDGSATMRFLDPKTFEVVKRITAHGFDGKINNLNELEYVNDEIWANIWYEDRIARLSPQTGDLLGWIDLASLYPKNQRATGEDVLNGIAHDPETKRLFITGKNWPQLFEITVGKK